MRHSPAQYENTREYPLITIGIVEDVTDAHQLGRMKVRCQSWLDGTTATENLPSTRMSSPLFGFDDNAKRGVNEIQSEGPVAYGQWTVPHVGAQVLVTLIDNDPNRRVFIASIAEMYLGHTLPHGRYLDDRIPKTSSESDIEPLATNSGKAFNGNRDSAEYATRQMDRQVSAYPATEFNERIVYSNEADQQEQTIENPDGSIIKRTQGYVDGKSAIYSNTTPGFHSMSMDDDPNNCRMRFRTTSGNQIIMDDTNERIYVSTATGKTWIEIDEKGTIDIYGEQDISISSDADVNITAKEKVRIAGGEGIHMTSGSDIRMHAKTDMSIKTESDLKIHSVNIKMETDEDLLTKVTGTQDTNAGNIIAVSKGNYGIKVADAFTLQSTGYDFDGTSITADMDIYGLNLFAEMNVTAGATVNALSVASTSISATGAIAAGGSMSAAGSLSSVGSISTKGIITSETDVVAGQTSLRSHTHMVPLPQHGAGMVPSQLATPSAASIPVVASPVVAAQVPIKPSPSSPASSNADAAEPLPAHFPSRIPQHEPFTRSYLKKDETDKDEAGESTLDLFEAVQNDIDTVLEYDSTNPSAGTGSSSRGKDFARNAKWRR